MAGEIERISAQDARRKAERGQAILVCAYDDEAKCSSMMLEDAISLAGLKARQSNLQPDRELIFYCG